MKKGRLIVIDGVDASGKSTQAELILKRLEAEGEKVKLISFPCYDEDYSAPIKMYLGGEFGNTPESVNAYAASAFYAVDRYCSYKKSWGRLLEEGYTLIAARYTTSNAIHQGEKFKKEERKAYFEWLYDFEFNKMALPKPDKVIFLNMPPEKSLELLMVRYKGEESKKDIHEKDNGYLFTCYETAVYAAEVLGWNTVNCTDASNNIRSVSEINDEIYSIIKR